MIISLPIPELWCRLKVKEKESKTMSKNGHLEKLDDFEFEEKKY